MNIQKIILLAGLLMMSVTCTADNNYLGQVGPTITCPPIGSLTQNDAHYWGSTDGQFRSFDISVCDKVDSFLGAQWQGTNIGRITCVYKPHMSDAFLITLLYNDLAYVPTGKNWHSSHQGAVYNCTSNDVTACSFSIRAAQPKINVYQKALNLRKEANPYDTPGF